MAILKKLKKGLKKAAKVAIPVGAALLAAKGIKIKNYWVRLKMVKVVLILLVEHYKL